MNDNDGPDFNEPADNPETDPTEEGFDEPDESVSSNIENADPSEDSDRLEEFDEVEKENGHRRIVIEAEEHDFKPADIVVEQGETVELILRSLKGEHQLKIPSLVVETDIVNKGEEDSIKYTFEEPGEFELVCGIHDGEEMKGTLLVEGQEGV